ncbi:hypothetical protein [Pseudoclavibacter helvolus]|uniref:hypothetical protein n=1 Tax=Pseudoclavibacter helvolus TaxID=255205 RepID=UPI0037364FE6
MLTTRLQDLEDLNDAKFSPSALAVLPDSYEEREQTLATALDLLIALHDAASLGCTLTVDGVQVDRAVERLGLLSVAVSIARTPRPRVTLAGLPFSEVCNALHDFASGK